MSSARWLPFVPVLALVSCAKFSGEESPADAAPEAAAGPVIASGNVFAMGTNVPVPDATVTAGGTAATTDANGHFAIEVTANKPFIPRFAADKFSALTSDEVSIGENRTFAVRFPMMNNGYAGALVSTYLNDPPYDLDRGSLAVLVNLRSGCASREGATVQVTVKDGKEAGIVRYFSAGFPRRNVESIGANETLSAIVYNLPTNVDLNVHVIGGGPSKGCKELGFPLEDEGVTLTGTPPQVLPRTALTITSRYLGN